MAGSLRNFQYVADDGSIYLFKGDESNVEAVNVAAANIATANVSRPGIPSNIRARRVFYGNATNTRIQSAIASTSAIYLNPPATIPETLPGGTGNLTLIRKVPETIRIFPNFDTGLTDGDAPL
jgi:hypothetical protein